MFYVDVKVIIHSCHTNSKDARSARNYRCQEAEVFKTRQWDWRCFEVAEREGRLNPEARNVDTEKERRGGETRGKERTRIIMN